MAYIAKNVFLCSPLRVHQYTRTVANTFMCAKPSGGTWTVPRGSRVPVAAPCFGTGEGRPLPAGAAAAARRGPCTSTLSSRTLFAMSYTV